MILKIMDNEKLMSVKTMQKRVCLEPKHLSSDYREKIKQDIIEKYENTCVKEVGYISKIIDIQKIIHDKVMNMIPFVFFLVEVQVLSYLPELNDIIDIKINFIFNHGIFGYYEKIKILIPMQACEEWMIHQKNQNETILIYKNDPKITLKKDDNIKVLVKNIRFEKDNFSCIGKIHESSFI